MGQELTCLRSTKVYTVLRARPCSHHRQVCYCGMIYTTPLIGCFFRCMSRSVAPLYQCQIAKERYPHVLKMPETLKLRMIRYLYTSSRTRSPALPSSTARPSHKAGSVRIPKTDPTLFCSAGITVNVSKHAFVSFRWECYDCAAFGQRIGVRRHLQPVVRVLFSNGTTRS